MTKESLSKKQSRFLWNIAKLIIYANSAGYDVTLGRGKETPEANKANGGIAKSCHLFGLAQDLNFFRNGEYLTKTEDLKIFGEYWKQHGGKWGGDFTNADGNHFSFAHNGVA